jgi:hypothetical protein
MFEENKYYTSGKDDIIYIMKIIKGVALCVVYSQNHNVYAYWTHLISDLILWNYKELEEYSWYNLFIDEMSFEELSNLH